MALKQLLLTKRISGLTAQLAELAGKDAGYAERAAALKLREAELEATIAEVTDQTPEEDKQVVEEAVTALEEDQAALKTEQDGNEADKTRLQDEIQKLQGELDDLNKKAAAPPAGDPHKEDERKDDHTMITRSKFFSTHEERAAFVARDDVKTFLTRVRELKGQQRGVTNADVLIPDVMVDLLRDNLTRYSKLISRVRLRSIRGTSRQNIAGTAPEGIWVEATAKLNSLDISFNQIEMDGYKVGGYIAIPNSTLEDSDINLAEEIMDALGQSIGYAVDKAIMYGTGVKMPVGIVTRLAQTTQPAYWENKAPTWTDLHTTNLLSLNPASYTTAEAYFAALLMKLAVAKPNYSDSQQFWVMNRFTHMTLLSKCLAFNAAAALLAGMNNSMPIIGGEIIELEFMTNYDIVGGFGSLYSLAERSGTILSMSEHALFTDDQTVYKGTARYDGKPVFGEGFVGVNINNTTVATTKTFASDTANP